MLRKSLLLMTAIAAFTMSASAVHITVPEGQPAVPGADSSIAANAYETYVTGHLSNINPSAAIKEKARLKAEAEKMVSDGKSTKDKMDIALQRAYERIDLRMNQSAVVLLHNQDNNIRVTVPANFVVGYYKENPDKKEYVSSLGDPSVIFFIGSDKNDSIKPEQIKKDKNGAFQYPGLAKAHWVISDTLFNQNAPLMAAIVSLDNQSNRQYLLGLSYKDQPITEKLERVMSNYVIPSIHSLDELDNYSETIRWDNFTYRIPKGMMLKAQKTLPKDLSEVREYIGPSMKMIVIRKPVKVEDIYNYNFFRKSVEIFNAAQPLSDTAVIQAASVWNNGIPSYLVDNYQASDKSRIYRFLRDDKYTYNILLYYIDGTGPYSHIQLRNTLEFSDFGNVATLRKKTIKISSKTNTTKGDTKAKQENISKDVKAVKNSKQIENDKKA